MPLNYNVKQTDTGAGGEKIQGGGATGKRA